MNNSGRSLFVICAFLFSQIEAIPCPPKSSDADIEPGDTAWLLVSSALVLLMTPGLAFYYSGLVRKKNVVNTLMMSYISVCTLVFS
jgi:Amt family ammonium transporter